MTRRKKKEPTSSADATDFSALSRVHYCLFIFFNHVQKRKKKKARIQNDRAPYAALRREKKKRPQFTTD